MYVQRYARGIGAEIRPANRGTGIHRVDGGEVHGPFGKLPVGYRFTRQPGHLSVAWIEDDPGKYGVNSHGRPFQQLQERSPYVKEHSRDLSFGIRRSDLFE
jgi:hypothetical protein